MPLVQDGALLVQTLAAEGLMETGSDQAIIGLMDMLDDPNLQVRITWR